MKLFLEINSDQSWKVETRDGEDKLLETRMVERAEHVLEIVEELIIRGGGWDTCVGCFADATQSKSFTNSRSLSVWLNTFAGLYELPIEWKKEKEGTWEKWHAPDELPYHSAPNITK